MSSISVWGQHYGEHRGYGTPNLGASEYRNRKIGAKKRMRTDPWAFSDRYFKLMLLRVFPKANTDGWQQMQAVRWLTVLRLYFRGDNGVVWTARLIAEQLNITTKQVQDIVCRMRRAARGLNTDGSRKTGRKRGRPKIRHYGMS